MSQELQIDISKGEFLPITFPVTREDTGAIFPLDDYEAFVTVAERTDPESNVIALASTGDTPRITISASLGEIVTSFIPGDTTPLAPKKYRYDVWIEHKTDTDDKRPVVRDETFNLEGAVRTFI